VATPDEFAFLHPAFRQPLTRAFRAVYVATQVVVESRLKRPYADVAYRWDPSRGDHYDRVEEAGGVIHQPAKAVGLETFRVISAALLLFEFLNVTECLEDLRGEPPTGRRLRAERDLAIALQSLMRYAGNMDRVLGPVVDVETVRRQAMKKNSDLAASTRKEATARVWRPVLDEYDRLYRQDNLEAAARKLRETMGLDVDTKTIKAHLREHAPLAVRNAWRAAAAVRPGRLVRTPSGREATVQTLTKKGRARCVYVDDGDDVELKVKDLKVIAPS
jgi:hypothetical protein